jgi:hypothetical protein
MSETKKDKPINPIEMFFSSNQYMKANGHQVPDSVIKNEVNELGTGILDSELFEGAKLSNGIKDRYNMGKKSKY